MASLNLEQIKRDGQDRIELADAVGQLQSVVDRIYPGYKVAVISPEEAAQVADPVVIVPPVPPEPDFRTLNGVQQMEATLRGGAMTARDLFAEIHRRGATIPMSTVQSTLSRKRDTFHNMGNGLWAVVQRTNGAH